MLQYVINIFLIGSFLGVLAGVINLAGIKGKYFVNLARDNKIMEMVIPSLRGDIVDRKGRIVATSVEQFNNTDKNEFEGKDLAFEIRRKYEYGESLGLISGYVGKVTSKDVLENQCPKKIDNNDLIGKMGIENQMDCKLRGVDGRRLVEVDAHGKFARELGRDEPEKGENIKLTIDAYWQEKVYKMLEGKKAVVIMSIPSTGEIVALVSSPAIDPNNFSFEVDNQMINNYLQDNDKLPLVNRAIAAKYHSGSVFKPIMSIAGLESGVVDKNTLIEDTGIIKVGDYSYSNWLWSKRGGTDGMVNITKALQRSNDIYFYRLGEKLGVDRIKQWAIEFGLGQKTGIELPGELSGIVPDEKWKIETRGEKWFLGNTYHLSIGQGDLSVTPIQINKMTQIVANRGLKCSTTIIDGQKHDCEKLPVKAESWNTVIEGMRLACQPGGTAWPLFNFKTSVACKTGTAEVGDGSKDTHAWLTAFAPIENPEIAITVLMERGGEGSDAAAPIVGDILKEWFDEPNTLVPRYTPTPEKAQSP